MAITFKRLGNNGIASAANTTLYTVPSLTQTEVKVCWIGNNTTGTCTLDIWHIPSGSSVTDLNKLVPTTTIPANDFVKIQADWQMAVGDSIQAKCQVNSAITVFLYGVENV